MSLVKTKKYQTRCAVLVLALISNTSIAMAEFNNGALVLDAICDDAVPASIFELGWLNETNGTKNIYYMNNDGDVSALTRDAPALKNIDNLRVINHGHCGGVGDMTSQEFATNLNKSYAPEAPFEVELTTCDGGSQGMNSPARVLSAEFKGKSKIMGWDGSVSLIGNGNIFLEDQQFGLQADEVNQDWLNERNVYAENIIARWDKDSDAAYNQHTCERRLEAALLNPNENDFMNFVRDTVNYYSSPLAVEEKFSVPVARSFTLQKGRTVCGLMVKKITGKDCITAE